MYFIVMIAIDQHKNRLIVGRTAGMFRRYKTAKSALRGNYNDLTDVGISVSYTHLDVYKRQMIHYY